MSFKLSKSTKLFGDFVSLSYRNITSTLLGPILVGLLMFIYFFDVEILDPSNIAWILRDTGDVTQHYLGSLAFRLDSWHFPITKTTMLYAPEGATIVYTDSNPLLSMIAKLLKGVFPPEFQFFGFWFLVCWTLQSVFGYLLIRKLTGNNLYALLAAVLFCLLPAQSSRIGHTNLVAFWIILWALYVYIDDKNTVSRKGFYFFIILIVASLIHAYLMAMAFFIALTWYIIQVIEFVQVKNTIAILKFIGIQVLYASSLVFFLWIIGYFYNAPSWYNGLNGYGFYSMNLNAPFNAMYTEFSQFMSPLPSSFGQYEGYQYLGMGCLILLFFVSFAGVQKYKFYKTSWGIFFLIILSGFLFLSNQSSTISLYERVVVFLFFISYVSLFYELYIRKEYKLLYLGITATFCMFYALSNRIVLGNTILFEIVPDERSFYVLFLQKFRSSGRFFWVTSIILLMVALTLLYKNRHTKSIYFLAVILFIQFMDVSKLKSLVNSTYGREYSPLDESSKNQIMAARSVKFLSEFNMDIAAFAVLNNKTLNKFYLAQSGGVESDIRLKSEIEEFKNNKRNEQDLYVFQTTSYLPVNETIHVRKMYEDFLSIAPFGYESNALDTVYRVRHSVSDSLSSIFKLLDTQSLVVLCVKDEASNQLPQFFTRRLDSLYHTNLSNLQYRGAYFAVFSKGGLMMEKMSNESAVEYKGIVDNYEIYVKSAGYTQGNEAIIMINGINFSPNERGINVLSTKKESLFSDTDKTDLIQVYNFDTHVNNFLY